MIAKDKLYRLLFIASIFLLLLNDLFLKYTFHNYLTGKLSDIVGLFAFPYFWASLYPQKRKLIYISTAFLFIFWKSEISQPLFDFAHNHGIRINRTIDYSDFFALLILPYSYLYWHSDSGIFLKPRRVVTMAIISVCVFSFIATTLPRKVYEYNLKSEHSKVVNTDLNTLKNIPSLYSNDDGSFNYYLDIPEGKARVELRIVVKEVDDNQLMIKVDSILKYHSIDRTDFVDSTDRNFMKNLSQESIEQAFDTAIEKSLKNQ